MPVIHTTVTFIKAAKEVHGNRFDYSKVQYLKSRLPVTIICKQHGRFYPEPASHLRGTGCSKCTGNYKKDFQKFKSEAAAKHANNYSYDGSSYTGYKGNISIICKHGVYTCTVSQHLYGRCCSLCATGIKTQKFVKAAQEVHKGLYQYTKTIFLGSLQEVEIVCKIHGSFFRIASEHLRGQGCRDCAVGKANDLKRKAFITKAKKVHGDLFNYDKVTYPLQKGRIEIVCKLHGSFLQAPATHLVGSGCPDCVAKSYSNIAINWIEQYAFTHRLKSIQHALNGGEYLIPSTRFKVDGYHPRSNTVFEFHGDAFHGNPNRYKPQDKCHPFNKNITADCLYKETLKREDLLKSLGYKLVVIWEYDYRLGYDFSYKL